MIAVVPQQRAFVVWWHELDKWMVPAAAIMARRLPKGWTIVRVADLVRQVTDRIEVNPQQQYKMAGVKWYGEGVFHRETVRGNEMSAKYVTPLKAGAFIYNRLFAWKASFAVVPGELADCHVSSEFPQFIVDETKLLPAYFHLFCTSSATVRSVLAASTGSSAVSRNRFREALFLDITITLPPLTIQQVIIANWEKTQAEVNALKTSIDKKDKALRKEFLDQLGIKTLEDVKLNKCYALSWDKIDRWSVEYLSRSMAGLNQSDTGRYEAQALSLLCDGQSGGTPSKTRTLYWNGDIPWVSPKDMKQFELHNTQDHISQAAIQNSSAPLIKPNSILVVVRSGILQRTVPIAINRVPLSINQDIRAFTVREERLLPDFLAYYLYAKQEDLVKLVKWSTTVQSINKDELEAFLIPLPPLEVQRNLIAKVEKQRYDIERMMAEVVRKSAQAKMDVDAMILGEKRISS